MNKEGKPENVEKTEKDGSVEKSKALTKKESLVPVSRERGLPLPLDSLSQYLKEINRYPLLTREEEEALAHHYSEHKDKESASKLVVSNLRLVVKIAMEYARAYHNILDLIQEGNTGLLKAVSKYDIQKGTRFSYYASWWIRAFILKFLVDNFRLVKIGTTQAQKKLFYNLMKEKQKIESMGFEALPQLMASQLDVKEKDVIEMEQRMGARDMSLDAPINGEDSKINMELFSSNDLPQDAVIEQEELKKKMFEHLDEFVSKLNDKEKTIFKERLYSEVPSTLQQIANEYGVSRERVRQIEERLVKRLKTFFKEKGFEVDLSSEK